MAAKAFTILTLALSVAASPIQAREGSLDTVVVGSTAPSFLVKRQEDEPAPKAPKGKKTGKSPKGSSSPAASPAASSGGSFMDALPFGSSLGSMGMMSSSDITKGNYQCKKAAFLFARGTGEPGNMGFVVGPPLGTQLRKQYGNDILIQGIDYSTTFTGSGATEMVKLTKQLIAKCPDTKIILSGYSQGAMQVHQALGTLGADAEKIAAAVTFGDPYSTMGWGSGGVVGSVMGLGGGLSSFGGSSKPKAAKDGAAPAPTGSGGFNPANGLILCSTGDFVCGVVPNIGGGSKGSAPQTGGKGGMGHISYSSDGSIGKAAAFIAEKLSS